MAKLQNANCISFKQLTENNFYMEKFVLASKFYATQKYFQWAVWL